MMNCLSIPSRGLRRSVAILTIWTSFCYLLFRVPDVEIRPSLSLHSRELLARQENVTSPSNILQSTTETTEVNVFEAQPYIDRSPKMNETEKAIKLQVQIPNLPLVYWFQNRKNNPSKNSSCAKYPSVYDIHFNNIYWQQTDTSNGTFFLYAAYLDVRASNRLGPTIRILTMINRIEPTVKTHCQLWFNSTNTPIFSKVLEYKYIWYKKWGNYKQGIFQPYLLACQIPKSHWGEVPASVSIVEKECDDATNNIRVIYNKHEGPKKKFAVCVKGLDFPDDDLSVRLVEWLELLNTLGAEKIFMYNLEVHPNVTKVLNHYVEKGIVDLTQLSLPGYQPNLPGLQHLYLKSKLNNKRQNELIPYNDCLYRNMYRYEYVALLDIDEVIMPLQHNSWQDMMEEVIKASLKVKNESRASYNFRNVYFMDEMLESNNHGHFKDIPPYLHMLQHVYRSSNYTKPGQYVKCFHNPEKALILHNHFPLGCLGGVCTSYPVEPELAHLQHYRSDCVSTLKKSCVDSFKKYSVKDTTIWKWKDQLISKTTSALLKMGFFGGKGENRLKELTEASPVNAVP
ncbi:uncharacterized protein LOC111699919 [Eurytemora carolleeae]|uniref:uncharacterized protein LOC111699919 n=1 Tax=Eurytemora carolleeae TaxID=1294199 RepID=UPI000C769E7C|nr:uncharacterized protein LOC111699919 [Eurytemora carolleeae]XP_023326461.1 uncharacterized protein LOC111699919 [Eurytemora carolleeae]XP_023326462.1 uncharacterized protein LOC111699919 [Eurytemora carolleeae]|eukprot:XP_023326460.1 uncharacterized protein LOC111699919 [Eurytemora affinis]